MVTIRIVVEGGVLPNANHGAATIANSERLREAFHKLFSQIFPSDTFKLMVETCGSYTKAVHTFKKYAERDNSCALLIDLDAGQEFRNDKIGMHQLSDFQNRVFFMIQEMESWILSQPEAIERACDDRFQRKHPKQGLSGDKLFQQHPETISNPSEALDKLLKSHYCENKNGVQKDKKYGKLKDAPIFIESLNIRLLQNTFVDVEMLAKHIQEQNSSRN